MILGDTMVQFSITQLSENSKSAARVHIFRYFLHFSFPINRSPPPTKKFANSLSPLGLFESSQSLGLVLELPILRPYLGAPNPQSLFGSSQSLILVWEFLNFYFYFLFFLFFIFYFFSFFLSYLCFFQWHGFL